MPLSSAKAGTQDNSNGTPFATAANEDSGSVPLPAAALVGNKTTWSETPRTGITSADAPTGGDLTTTGFAGSAGANLFDVGNAMAVAIRATCNTASKTLTGRLVLYDGSNNPISVSETISFTSDATLRLGNASGDFVCQRQIVDVGQARKARFFVDSVGSSSTWAIYCRPI